LALKRQAQEAITHHLDVPEERHGIICREGSEDRWLIKVVGDHGDLQKVVAKDRDGIEPREVVAELLHHPGAFCLSFG